MVTAEDQPVVTGHFGGQPKQRYWTPDGREIYAMPDMHEFARTINGKVVGQGIRDANLDKGWLIQEPIKLQLHCPHCDYWHSTQKERKECEAKKNAFIEKHSKLAKKELKVDSSVRIDKLEEAMSEIKTMLVNLTKKIGK